MKELEQIFYGPKRDGRNVDYSLLRKYMDALRTDVDSPDNESRVKSIFSKVTKVDKIPENKEKRTYDYKLDEERILMEVTSIEADISGNPTLPPEKILDKVQTAIEHIKKKDSSEFPGYAKVGVVFYDLIFNLFNKFHSRLDESFPEWSGLAESDLDALVLIHQPASISGESSFEKYPVVCYVRSEPLAELLERAFRKSGIKTVILPF